MLLPMSTHAINLWHTETLSEAVARRLRGALGERQISGSELARKLGMAQTAVSRRLAGKIPLDVNELQHIEEATGITVAYLMGLQENPPPYGGGNRLPKLREVSRNRASALYKSDCSHLVLSTHPELVAA